MFDPINGPANHYQGPATGLGTEAGDTWHTAVEKINAGFKRVVGAIEGLGETADTEARKSISTLEDTVTALQKRAEDSDASMKALLASFDKFLAAAEAKAAPTPPTGDAPKTE